MKKILIIFILLSLTGCNKVIEDNTLGSTVSTTTTTKINVEKEIIKIEKQQDKEREGKYKRKENYNKDGIDYEVHEYVTPSGEIGYQIFIVNDSFEQSIGYGIESTTRTWINYFPIEATTSSSTSKKESPKNLTVEF